MEEGTSVVLPDMSPHHLHFLHLAWYLIRLFCSGVNSSFHVVSRGVTSCF